MAPKQFMYISYQASSTNKLVTKQKLDDELYLVKFALLL